MTADFRYDAFLSYRHQEPDKTWVRKFLLERLKAAGLVVCVDIECFRLGAALLAEMERAVLQSRYTVAVLTPEYLQGNFAALENLMADHLGIEESRRRLVSLMRRRCDPGLRLRSRLWLDVTDDAELDENLGRLIAQLRLPPDN